MATTKPNQELVGRRFYKVDFYGLGPDARPVVSAFEVTRTWGTDHVYAKNVNHQRQPWQTKDADFRYALKGLAWSESEAWQQLMVSRSVRLGSLQADVREAEAELEAILEAMKAVL